MKALSDTLQIPCYYLSTHTEGLVAMARGIDAFSQPFNRIQNVPRQPVFGKVAIKKMWDDNKKLTSGSIYNYKAKEMETRIKFEETAAANGNLVNAPVGELARTTLNEIKNMTPNRFRIYSKMYLMAVRNLEAQELYDAIQGGTVRTLRTKFRSWIKDLSFFP